MRIRALRRPFLFSVPFVCASCAWWNTPNDARDASTAGPRSTAAAAASQDPDYDLPVSSDYVEPFEGRVAGTPRFDDRYRDDDRYDDRVVRSGAETPEEAPLSTTPRERDELARLDGAREPWTPGVQRDGASNTARAEGRSFGRFDERSLAEWSAEPKAVVMATCQRYGDPDVVAADRVEWKDAGPYKRIVVRREAFRHDQPAPHVDVVTHTVAYTVPADKVGDVEDFDRCVDADRARGELSASGRSEADNVVALNLAHSIAEGDMDGAQARQKKQQALADVSAGKDSELSSALHFQRNGEGAMRGDVGTAEASAGRERDRKRSDANKNAMPTQPEIVAKLNVLDELEIQAAKDAQQKQLAQPMLEFARKLETFHADCRDKTREVAGNLDITPADSSAISEMRKQAADERESIADLEGERFADAWLAQRIECHEKAIQKIDEKFLPAATSDELREHLNATRTKLAAHLAEARRLRDQ